MKRLLSIVLLALVTAAGHAADFPAGSPPFFRKYDEALEKAKSSGKPAIVIFSASWCPPCQEMKRTVYPSAEVRPLHDKFVWAYLDFDDPANRPLAAKYKVESIPQIFFFSPSGKPVAAMNTFFPPKEFAAALQQVLDEPAIKGKPAGSK